MTSSELWDLALDARRAQFVPPSTMWQRPFGLTNLAAQSTTHGDERFNTILAAQLMGYSIKDPETKQSQAVPAAVVAIMESANASAELHRSVGQLAVGAFFFAMRACEFSNEGGPRRTRTLTFRDHIEFRRDRREIKSDDEDEMATADTI